MDRIPARLWWLIHKDLVSELRARQVWPAMLLLGIVVVLVFTIQMDLAPAQKHRVAGGLLWLAIFFAGTLALDRSFGNEREEQCLRGLLLYPIPAATVYLAKLLVNVILLGCLQLALIPLFVVFADVPLFRHPWATLAVALLGNLGIVAVGTLLSAATSGIGQRGHLLALLALPVVLPVVLGAAEAMRLILEGDFGSQWWRWLGLLGAFALLFTTLGLALFDFVIEE